MPRWRRRGRGFGPTWSWRNPGAAHLEKIWPDSEAVQAEIAAGARALREDTHDRGNGAYREIGEAMPDFTLYDQTGKVVESGRFRGKQIMLNFIYTRCPLADMCPASTAKMMSAQKLARTAGVKDLELVSVTLDPAYDTPGVVKEYADERGIDTGNFSFLTGPEGAIRDLLSQFGVIAEFQGGILKHTLATLLIDEKGRIVWRADGSQWESRRLRGPDAQDMSAVAPGARPRSITLAAALLLAGFHFLPRGSSLTPMDFLADKATVLQFCDARDSRPLAAAAGGEPVTMILTPPAADGRTASLRLTTISHKPVGPDDLLPRNHPVVRTAIVDPAGTRLPPTDARPGKIPGEWTFRLAPTAGTYRVSASFTPAATGAEISAASAFTVLR